MNYFAYDSTWIVYSINAAVILLIPMLFADFNSDDNVFKLVGIFYSVIAFMLQLSISTMILCVVFYFVILKLLSQRKS